MSAVDIARKEYAELCASFGLDAVTEENAILSVGREFLPACALVVRDHTGPTTVEYYEWLTEQTSTAQRAVQS